MNRIRQSLALKLGIGILLMTIFIFVVSLGILFLQSRRMVRQGATERANAVLSTTVQRLCRYLNTIETATDAHDWLIPHHLHPDSLLAYSHRIVQLNRHVDGCSISTEPEVFPRFGTHFSAYTVRKNDSVETVIEEPYDYFDKIWYATPRDTRQTCWVVYYDETDSLALTLDGLIASYCKPIYDNRQQFVGVISSDIALLRLSEIISAEKPYPHSYFMLIGDDGRYLTHPDPQKLFRETIHHDSLLATRHNLVCYQPVPGTGWQLAIVCPDSDILQGYYQLGHVVTPLIVGGLLLILLFSLWAVTHAIKPISQLLSHTRLIADGNYDKPFPPSQRQDVIGRLQNSFAAMQQSLNFHVGSIRYVTEQTSRRNAELAHATHLTEEADRQKAIFIQNVTHQIRTPLNIIMGFAQVLRDSGRQLPTEELSSITETMQHSAASLQRMVLMLFDSSESGRSQEFQQHIRDLVSCNDIARQCIADTYSHFPHLTVHFQSALSDTFCIHTNPLYLMRSLRELLYNAAKYSDGSHLSLYVSQTPLTVRFVMEDVGPGIPASFRELMFVPFTKVNDLSEGLGLGLPLAKRHVDNLGGTLTLDTHYQEGCRFIIEIPR